MTTHNGVAQGGPTIATLVLQGELQVRRARELAAASDLLREELRRTIIKLRTGRMRRDRPAKPR